MSEPRPDDYSLMDLVHDQKVSRDKIKLISGSLTELIDHVGRLEANLCWVFVLASSVWACVVGMMLLEWGLE